MQHIRSLTPGVVFWLNTPMKIQDVYEKHSSRLIAAAHAGRPYAALTYGPNCTNSHFRTFADKSAADSFLTAAQKPGSGIGGVVAHTDAQTERYKYYVRPVTGYRSFA